ncbi:YhdT family protein [Oceanisphaera sp. IT1-181]|uniref:YhdT family protein n=1 Tax=Oceanisphaera sp. IT1-181 TaxID=3081199 RepID=UPI0029CA2CBF|nr:YhdT family protein [Oceanisphaera sp. IT1-181]
MNHLVTIARREALLSLGLAVLYMLGWWLSAYAVPSTIMWHGWPLWFVLSCVFNPLLFIGLCAIMIKRYFKNLPLDAALTDAGTEDAKVTDAKLKAKATAPIADAASITQADATHAAVPLRTHLRPH